MQSPNKRQLAYLLTASAISSAAYISIIAAAAVVQPEVAIHDPVITQPPLKTTAALC